MKECRPSAAKKESVFGSRYSTLVHDERIAILDGSFRPRLQRFGKDNHLSILAMPWQGSFSVVRQHYSS